MKNDVVEAKAYLFIRRPITILSNRFNMSYGSDDSPTMLRWVRDAHAGRRPDSSEQTDVVCWLQHMHT